jgi:hypothetical protein
MGDGRISTGMDIDGERKPSSLELKEYLEKHPEQIRWKVYSKK